MDNRVRNELSNSGSVPVSGQRGRLAVIAVFLLAGGAALNAQLSEIAMVRTTDETLRIRRGRESRLIESATIAASPVSVSPTNVSNLSSARMDEIVPLRFEQAAITPVNPLVLNRRSLIEGRTRTCIEAGFGELFGGKPPEIYGRNGTLWEEPGCGYIRLRFAF